MDRCGYGPHKPLLHWHFHPHTKMLSEVRPLYLRITPVHYYSKHLFGFGLVCLRPLSPPPHFCVYHKPVLLKVAPSGYKNIISAYIKKMWLSGAAGNQKHPYKTPGPPPKVVPAKFLVALSFRGHRGSPRPLGAAPGLQACRTTMVRYVKEYVENFPSVDSL